MYYTLTFWSRNNSYVSRLSKETKDTAASEDLRICVTLIGLINLKTAKKTAKTIKLPLYISTLRPNLKIKNKKIMFE